MNYNQGLVVQPIQVDAHILGTSGIPLPVIKVDGDWRKYRLPFESQLLPSYDTFGCTVWATLKAIAKLEKFVYGTDNNHSERFTYNVAEIKPPGDDPHRIATLIRGSGLLPQADLISEVPSLAEFMTPRPLPIDLRIKGQKWLNKQMLGHKWLWETKPDQKTRIALITEALTKGTVCISVTAWYQDEQGLYYSPQGLPNGHWTQVEYIDDTGIYVDDSYNDVKTNTNLKKLTLDHDIQFAKVYFFTVPTVQQNWFVSLIISLLEIVGLKQKQVIEVKKNEVTPYKPINEVIPPMNPNIPLPVNPPKYLWGNIAEVRHSIRLICDEEGMTLLQKNMCCDIASCESQFNPSVRGRIDPRDRGLFQWNSRWHPEITDEIAFDPEKNTRLACKAIKQGKTKIYWQASMKCWNKGNKYFVS